ncbi:Two-component response regulator 24 [Linum grandiflorum]
MGSEDISNKYGTIKALVVDDEPVAKMLHPKHLEKVGILNVEVVSNGEEAVDLVESLGVEYFDVILMDIDMPVMNGIVAAKMMRDMGVRNMIVGVSSRSRTEAVIVETMESGIMDDYIEKPLIRDDIISIAEKCIERI